MVPKGLPLGGAILERMRRELKRRLEGFIKAKKREWFNEKQMIL
jgi:hypothetical protein